MDLRLALEAGRGVSWRIGASDGVDSSDGSLGHIDHRQRGLPRDYDLGAADGRAAKSIGRSRATADK